jgi:23S rRNA G2445 N2-methylase RlmL
MACDIAPRLMRIKCNAIGSRTPPIVRWNHPPSFLANDARTSSSDISVEEIWKQILMDATKRAKDGLKKLATDDPKQRKVHIVGNYVYPNTIQLADDALKIAGLRHIVDLSSIDCNEWKPHQFLMIPSHPGADIDTDNNNQNNDNDTSWMVVCNPPWVVRLGGDDEEYVRDAWESLRVFLRQTCPPGATTAFILSGNKDRTKHLGLQRSSSLPIKIGEQDLRYLEYVIRNKNDDNNSNNSNDNINNSSNYGDDGSNQQAETIRAKHM